MDHIIIDLFIFLILFVWLGLKKSIASDFADYYACDRDKYIKESNQLWYRICLFVSVPACIYLIGRSGGLRIPYFLFPKPYHLYNNIFWFSLIVEMLIASYWIVFKGGATKLSGHPELCGLHPINVETFGEYSPGFIKFIFFLGNLILWGFLAFSFYYDL